jgi:tetratricopeptide (TPR) repeat protein
MFVVLGPVVVFAYYKLRAGDIQIATGNKSYDAGMYALAEDAYLRAAQASPKNPDAWYWLGMSRKCQGKSKPAAEALSQATSLNPKNPQWWYECAEALQWAERFGDAEAAWSRTLELLPPDDGRILQVKMQLARCLVGAGQVNQAVNMLEDVLASQDDRRVRFVLAELLGYAGRFEESANEYRRALGGTSESKPE